MDVMVNEIGVYCLANTGSGMTREMFFSTSKRHCFNAVLATAEKQAVFFFFFPPKKKLLSQLCQAILQHGCFPAVK